MPTLYDERLHVPLRWWVQATMFLATFWLAFSVAMPLWIASGGALALTAVVYAFFAWIGSVRVRVADGVLHAGDARIPVSLLGEVLPLDKEQTRRVHGVEADARAYLVTRPYVSRSVKVAIADPADPTPYWLISTRHPRKLAAALARDVGSTSAAG